MKSLLHLLGATVFILGLAAAVTHRRAATASSAAFQTTGSNQVEISVRDGFRFITANGWPDHAPGEFPNPGNPNAIRSQRYNFRVPANPQIAAQPTVAQRQPFGVALNGIPFDPGTAEFWRNDPTSGWNYDALSGRLNLGLDANNAHVQPNGAYHYHGLPVGLLAKLGGGQRMQLIGYAADGFPIYSQFGYREAANARSPLKEMRSSYRLKAGARPSNAPQGKFDGTFVEDWEYVAGTGDLDECNGRFGVTPEYPAGIYHYYVTKEFPFIARLYRGTPDDSFKRRGPGGPPPRPGFGPPPPWRP